LKILDCVRYGCFLVLLLLATALHAAAAGLELVNVQESLLAVEIDRQRVSQGSLVLLLADASVWITAADLQDWRLLAPPTGARLYQGQTYYELGAIAHLRYHVDQARQVLAITATPQALLPSAPISLERPSPYAPQPHPGGFLNYDLFARNDGQEGKVGSASFEMGVFNRYGVGIASVVFPGGDQGGRGVRLDTTWVQDRPEDVASLRLGDGISRNLALIGGATRFGGIQYATNFSTQPNLITQPLQAVSGAAILPSVASVYVNNNLLTRQNVGAGTFNITHIPTITGSGEVTVVVRDIQGRETVLTQPYFTSPVLLRQGLSDYSFEAGWERENFGDASWNYGSPLASASYRYGFSDTFTGEAHAEWLQGQATAGLGGDWLLSRYGVLGTGLALSTVAEGAGALFGLSYQYSDERFSVGFRNLWASRNYRQIGIPEDELAPRRITDMFLGLQMGRLGSLTVGYSDNDYRDQAASGFLTLSYQAELPGKLSLLVNYFQAIGNAENTSITFSLVLPWGNRDTATLQHQRTRVENGATAGSTTITQQHALPAGEGWGYLVQANDSDVYELGLAYQGRYGSYGAGAKRQPDGDTWNLSASGGIATLGGGVFASRRIRCTSGSAG
jgi:outer membrane usher protein